MGKSFFLDHRGLCLAQVWLLAFCLLLSLTHEASALLECRMCDGYHEVSTCWPLFRRCPGVKCAKRINYDVKTGKKLSHHLYCYGKNFQQCGKTSVDKYTKTVYLCCDSGDVCFKT